MGGTRDRAEITIYYKTFSEVRDSVPSASCFRYSFVTLPSSLLPAHQANVENAAASTNGSCTGGDGSASKRCRGYSVGAGCEKSTEEWAAASAMLLEVASELRAAVEPGGIRGDGPNSPARALASAFAAAPASEVSAALQRRFLERGVSTGKEAEHGGCGVGDAVRSSPGGAKRGEAGTRGLSSRSIVIMGEGSREEAIAHAMADACRDIVLKCLLG